LILDGNTVATTGLVHPEIAAVPAKLASNKDVLAVRL
jgi:hypothetical protein